MEGEIGLQMIVVANRLQVATGFEEEFEKQFQDRVEMVEDAPGFIRNEVLRPLKSDYYVVKTYWADRTSFEAWTQSDSFKRAHAAYPPKEIFSGPNVLEIHEVIQATGQQ